MLTPIRASATTTRPVTAPPRRAACRALFSEVRAAAAARMLVRMETYMPVKPASPEQVAPTRKLMTVWSARAAVRGEAW